jgi:hypothetical protein
MLKKIERKKGKTFSSTISFQIFFDFRSSFLALSLDHAQREFVEIEFFVDTLVRGRTGMCYRYETQEGKF